ncbi:MAG: hypothetical protein JST26_11740 [Bacteroidetes bacterium]|nr:hypothetical protein [Bacteroidota bacterium]
MKPYIKEIYIQDIGFFDSVEFKENDFLFERLEIRIAYEATEGIDIFFIDLCNKKGLIREIDNLFESKYEVENSVKSCFAPKFFIVKEVCKKAIFEELSLYVSSCVGESYNVVFRNLKEKLEYYP